MSHDDLQVARCHSIVRDLSDEFWRLSEQVIEDYIAKILGIISENTTDDDLLNIVQKYHCLRLIEQVQSDEEWKLSNKEMDEYASKIMQITSINISNDVLIGRIKQFYHDKVLVRALIEPNDPNHVQAWKSVFYQVKRIIDWNNARETDIMLESDDIVQDACVNVINSIRNFDFRSKFSTWLTSLVKNVFKQVLRSKSTKKRSGTIEPLNDFIPASKSEQPEYKTEMAIILDLVRQVLIGHRDKRLVDIFMLVEIEDRTKAEIGQMLNLHPSRVRELLSQAKRLLRADPSLRSWYRLSVQAGEPEDMNEKKINL